MHKSVRNTGQPHFKTTYCIYNKLSQNKASTHSRDAKPSVYVRIQTAHKHDTNIYQLLRVINQQLVTWERRRTSEVVWLGQSLWSPACASPRFSTVSKFALSFGTVKHQAFLAAWREIDGEKVNQSIRWQKLSLISKASTKILTRH